MKNIAKLMLASAAVVAMAVSAGAQSPAASRAEGVWQLSIPSSQDGDAKISFLPAWKIYYPDGRFTVITWGSSTESAIITTTGRYTVERDTLITETVDYDADLKPGTVNHIHAQFIGNQLMNTLHDTGSGKWQELWKRVSAKGDDSYLPYVKSFPKGDDKSDDTQKMPARDFNGVYFYAERMPEYPGGEKAMTEKISKSIEYPLESQQKGHEGTTLVRFVVNEKGKPESMQIIRSSFPDLDAEAIRVVGDLRFKAGSQGGKKVKVYMTIPVRFVLK